MSLQDDEREELRRKFDEYHRTGDPGLRDELVTAHLGLAEYLARRFANRGEPLDDLVQVASVGLLKAVDRFDPERGLEFSTYATPTIVGELKRHFRDKGWAVRVPRRVQELHLRLGKVVSSLSQDLGRSPTIGEIAERAGASEEEVLEAMEAGRAYRFASLDAPGRARVVIRKALSADHDVTMAETSRRGNATRLAQDAAAAGYDAVVVLGGDGTLNEAANGLAGSQTAMATLPGGSTNVFARTLGIAQDPVEATGELLSALARGSLRRIGLGSVNGRYFLFHVGMGFDAAVVSQVERRAALKRYAGHPLFVYAAFSTWFRHYDRTRPRLEIHHAD